LTAQEDHTIVWLDAELGGRKLRDLADSQIRALLGRKS
jgi:hypothetical protein